MRNHDNEQGISNRETARQEEAERRKFPSASHQVPGAFGEEPAGARAIGPAVTNQEHSVTPAITVLDSRS